MEKKSYSKDKQKKKKMNRKNKNLIIGIGIILLVVFSMIIVLAWPLLTGKTIVLATRQVDPFDVLRGQYINLNYEISSVPAIEKANFDDTIYVELEKDQAGIWRYKSASLLKPSTGDFIKGKVTTNFGDTMQVRYGIEDYYFEKNAYLPRTNLTVELKVSGFGIARISRILYLGKPVSISYTNPTVTS